MSIGHTGLLLGSPAEPRGTAGPRRPDGARRSLRVFAARLRGDRAGWPALATAGLLVVCAILAPQLVSLFGAPGPNVRDPAALTALGSPTGPSHHAVWPFIAALAGIGLAVAATYLPGRTLPRRAPAVIAALAIVAAIVLAAIAWPSATHILGVDSAGRDVFARVLYGLRTSLLVAAIATALALLAALAIGLVAAFGAVPDAIVAAFTDVLLVVPALLLALGLSVACSQPRGCVAGSLHPGVTLTIIVIAVVDWAVAGRVLRARVRALSAEQFVAAARGLGASRTRVVLKEVLPNLGVPVLAVATVLVPQNMAFESALSFLGAGVRGHTVSWGTMLAGASSDYYEAWWSIVSPGAALLLGVLTFTLAGAAVRRALRP
ncbi:MAG TPA: ABC transporter permease [Solirubrobacteraceae bacterium]|nr:ABC transporter permease [Solirubrobacteraceae bacterium]